MTMKSNAAQPQGAANWLSGGGEMGERIRAFDWARSPLGPVETWPQSLKTAVRIMPGEDGYDLIRRVRTHPHPRVSKIQAVALTAYARFEDRLRALEAGYQMHVAKPVQEAELNTVIAALTGRLFR